jgi:hypothetical protein
VRAQVPWRRVSSLESTDREHRRFDGQRGVILAALAELPGDRLAYGDDPAEAAAFFRSLLDRETALEA